MHMTTALKKKMFKDIQNYLFKFPRLRTERNYFRQTSVSSAYNKRRHRSLTTHAVFYFVAELF